MFGVFLLFLISLNQILCQDSLSEIAEREIVNPLLRSDTSLLSEFITRALEIHSGENHNLRWLSIIPANSDSLLTIRQPIFETDAVAGSFRFYLTGIDSTAFLGNRMLQNHGHFPIQYKVFFGDPQSLTIVGKTLPYDDATCYFSFGPSEYRMDFIYDDVSKDPDSMIPVGNHEIQTEKLQTKGSREIERMSEAAGGRMSALKAMLWRALFITGGITGTIILIIVLVYRMKILNQQRKISSSHFADVLERKTEDSASTIKKFDEENETSSKEQREGRIRRLMEREGISYDEAALRDQYQTLNEPHDQK